MKEVITGIRLDDHAKELLDWELVKVADSGDSVVAIHVCRNSGNPFSFAFLNPSCFSSKCSVADSVSNEKIMLDGYLKDYEGLCSEKHCSSIERKFDQKKVILGITKHGSIRIILLR
ncbi:protein kinase protein with adenine nucleotidealpha hydrolases-like domain, partial [Striga asiatica]